MANSYIDFACVQQKLERTDEKPVASGASVLVARFDLCQKWDGLTVWARFKHGAAVYDVPVIDGCAQIPWEVVNYTGFSVSIWGEKEGGGRLTSAKVFVDVKRSIEPEGVAPLPSTPSQVEMFIAKASAAEAAAGNAAQSAKAAADAASVAPESAAAAQAAAAVAEASAAEAAASKATATTKANAAASSASAAASSESGALAAKIDAEEAADAAATYVTAAGNSATAAANSATAAAKSAKEAKEAAANAGGGTGGGVSAAFDSLLLVDSVFGDQTYYEAENYNQIMLVSGDGVDISGVPYDDDGDGESDTVKITISAMGGGSGDGSGDGSASATAAAESARNAAASASEAAASAQAAADSATTATGKASAASDSATAAAGSATAAGNSATAAEQSAEEAAVSASTATSKAGAAATSATNASNSATAANTSAANAATSASNASASAKTASDKATAAANSASAAKTSETNASNSATAAAASATAAQNAANSAFASVEVGSVTAGETASVTNSGSGRDAVLDFVLPRGATGQRGAGIYSVTTAPSSYTTAIGDFTPKYRIKLSTAKAQSGATEIIVGDQIRYSYYTYPIDYVDSSYAYMATRVSLRGATGEAGADGKDYSFDPTAYRLPILYLTGDTTGISKDNAVTLSYEYGENSGSCTLKWQGSSSLAWDKKNYTIKTDTAFEAVEGWGAQKKYCLKANWIDHSHSRNVVSAKLWGLVRKSGANTPANLKALPNAGAIDGFPVIIMLNGEFHGLYSFNIPKDAWQFGMGSGTKEAIVGADNQADDTAFKAETLLDADGWELEYNSDSFSETAVKDSLNNLIRACMNTTGSDLDTTVAQYLDWESAIDYYIFAVILKGGDMITKNTLLATFDGVKWYFSAYDMDTTYGLEFDGSCLTRAVSNTNFEEIAAAHRVFELIKRFKTDALKARYKELRANALSETRICQYFENYLWDVSSPILAEDVKRWPSVRGSSVNGIDQICRWVRQRLEAADAWANALPAQETPVEIVNLVPTSTDTDGSVYNGTGYKDNARLSSSGGVSGTAQNGSVVTGFIPFKNTDVIRIKGAEWIGATAKYGGHFYWSLYDSNKSLIDKGYISSEAWDRGSFSTQVSGSYDEATGTTTFELVNPTGTAGDFRLAAQKAAFFRINAYGKGSDLIITANQEITA